MPTTWPPDGLLAALRGRSSGCVTPGALPTAQQLYEALADLTAAVAYLEETGALDRAKAAPLAQLGQASTTATASGTRARAQPKAKLAAKPKPKPAAKPKPKAGAKPKA